jgi:nitrite reductase/ring-hydroxylating ferredoxin subunit
VQEGAGAEIKVGNKTLAFFKVDGTCYAISNACPHKGGPLGKGTLSGHIVTCPWHGWTWDVRTGMNVRAPKLKGVECFPVKAVDGQLFVELPDEPTV